jgi:hypothetical protein
VRVCREIKSVSDKQKSGEEIGDAFNIGGRFPELSKGNTS